ncbi:MULTISPECIES: glycosyltransferase family 2 protein [Spirulina sp. CCY15215]|uniref:glycosyltransferase family 2 protein n=1 Tax=Spirulina sp. CCY15215 TaxID=2767591 RepID=UPI0019517B3F
MISNTLPKISIITPSFNQVEFLEATIKSILNQEYPNLEYIIIDGGSTDGSVEIIKKYAEYLHFWCSEPDGGHYNAVNKGFENSTGEIMAWLNSDDMYYPWTLHTVGSIMSQFPQVEWLTSLYPGVWDRDGFCIKMQPISGYSRESFLEGSHLPGVSNSPSLSCIQQESSFWRSSLWRKAGNQIVNSFSLAGDFDLWTRFYLYADLFGVVSPLGGFRKHETQRSRNNPDRYIEEAKLSLNEMREKLNWSPNQMRKLSWRFRLYKIPAIANNQFFINSLGFQGQKVSKLSLNPKWMIDEYRFSYT